MACRSDVATARHRDVIAARRTLTWSYSILDARCARLGARKAQGPQRYEL